MLPALEHQRYETSYDHLTLLQLSTTDSFQPSDICPAPRGAEKPQRSNPVLVLDFCKSMQKAPKFSTKLFLMMEMDYVAPLPDPSHLLPSVSILPYPSLLMDSPSPDLKKLKKILNPKNPKLVQNAPRGVFSSNRTHCSSSSAQDSRTSVKDLERLGLWPDSTTDTDAPRSGVLTFPNTALKSQTKGLAFIPDKRL